MRFVNPPNGARDVARLPVITVAFDAAVPDEAAWLRSRVRLLDRLGHPVPLALRRAPGDPSVVLASPAGPEARLLPASDYFLELGADAARTHFETGGAKSVFCVRARDAGTWENACDESYWLGASRAGEPCGDRDPDGSCSCRMEPSPDSIGGVSASCHCLEEERFWAGELEAHAYLGGVSPAPGSSVAAPARVEVRVLGELGPAAGEYRLRVEDVTDAASAPRPVHEGAVEHDGPLLWLDTPGLTSRHRYRVTLLRADARLVGARVEGASWTFDTWPDAPAPRFTAMIPGPRSEGVPYPTHLTTRPHLRFLTSGPLAAGVGALAGPVLELRADGGEPVRGYATWYDRDMDRLHLMVYAPLEPGTRYVVRCAAGLAERLGAAACARPLGRFLVQAPPPPAAGIRDVRYGPREKHEPEGERWLPLHPTVFDHPYGIKQRYRRDAAGPASFLGHVLLVPDDEPAGALHLRVEAGCAQPDPGCAALLSGAQPACTLEQALACTARQARPVVIELGPGRHEAGLRVRRATGGAPVLVRGRPGSAPPVLDGLRALSSGVGVARRPGLPRGACSLEHGFVWDESRARCEIDPQQEAFQCDAGRRECRSRWLRIDAGNNVWRLWWPSPHSGAGLEFGLFALAKDGPPSTIPMIDTQGADYDPCRRAADPPGCSLARCRDWNAATLAGQRDLKLEELRAAPAPAALWLTGHRVAAAKECRELSSFRSFRIEEQPGAPAALYLKLPPGQTPAGVVLRGAPAQQAALRLEGVQGWTLRGLVFPEQTAPILLRDAVGVRFEGNQVAGTTRAALRAVGATRGLVIAHGSFADTPPLEYESSEPGFTIENSLLLGVSGKAIKSRRELVAGQTPALCSAADPDCPVPPCRSDRDCRIPFLGADGALDAPAARESRQGQPRCLVPERGRAPGRCSHGLAGQTLIHDNVFLGAAGLDGGHWYALRLQRNYFEGTGGQEWLDASEGAAYVSLLDNVSFGSSSRSRLILLGAAARAERPAWQRALAIDGNYILQTTPGEPSLDLRRGPLRLGANTAVVTTWKPHYERGVDASGLRIVDNVILGRPGGREWGLGRSGGISAVDIRDVFIARNSVLVDTEVGIEARAGSNRLAPRGRAAANLVVATGRSELRSNLCEEPPGPSLVVPAEGDFALAGNAAVRGVAGAPGSQAANLALAPEERERLLVEPLPASPPIDMELFQRQASPDPRAADARRREWPLYEPALLDDVLRVRRGHRACAVGAHADPDCAQASSVSAGGPK